MKVCRFIDKYVTRIYGTRVVSTWFAKNEGRTIFDLITMSDLAYTVAVVENGHETWDEMIDTSQGRDSPKKGRTQERVQYYRMESRGYRLL